MKKTLILVGVLAMSYTYAQQGKVGVNTEAPQATFEVAPSTANALATATTNEGIIAPKLTKTRIANIATPVEGTLVYATDATYAGTNNKVSKITEKGYYFYNGTEWVKASGDAAGATLPATATNGQVLKWNGTAWVAQADANTTYTGSTSVVLSGNSFQRAALTGDVTSAQNNNTVTINNGAVTGAKIAAGTITADKLAPGVIPAAQAEVDGIIGNEVTNATASKGLVRAGAGTNADPYTLGVADGGITNAMIANNAINSAKIQDGTIVAGDLANNAVTGAKIANGTITADKLAAGVIPAAQAEVDGIIGNEVTNATASKGLVRAGAGTNADPYTLGVADGGITNAMIANNAINSAKIQDGTIAAGDLANNAVTGAKIANGTITADKLNAMGATTAGQVLKWNGTAWAPAADVDTNTTYTAGTGIEITGSNNAIAIKTPVRTVTGNYTLTAADNNGYVYVNVAGPTGVSSAGAIGTSLSPTPVATVTIPSNLPEGFSCIIVQQGTGTVGIAGNGVTLQTARGTKTRTQYSAVGIIKRVAGEATITGDAVN